MNGKWLQLTILAGWLSLQAVAAAQSPGGETRDHPSHRYLPPPYGKANLSDQIDSLDQLNRAPEPNEPSPIELSPAQLKQLDAILESFRGENGELNVPSPDQVPKQWIDSVLPDPKQRQQAKEMLEEYSRTRKVPWNQGTGPSALPPIDSTKSSSPPSRPMSDPTQRDNENMRDPFGPTSGRNRTSESGAASRTAERNRQGESRQGDSRTPSGNDVPFGNESPSSQNAPNVDELPKDTPPALRNLYETLKQFQQQRAEQEKRESSSARIERRESQARRDRSAQGAPPRNDPRASRPPRPNDTARNPSRAPNPNLNRPSTPNNLPPSRLRSQPQITDNDTANGIGTSGNGNGLNGNAANSNDSENSTLKSAKDDSLLKAGVGSNPQSPDELGKAAPQGSEKPKLTPFDEGFDFSADQKVTVDPFAAPEDPTFNSGGAAKKFTPPPKASEPLNVTRLSQQPPSRPGPNSSSNANAGNVNTRSGASGNGNSQGTEETFDWKKSVNDLGLGPVLKRIVQKTLKEQGFDPAQPGASAAPNSGASGSANASSNPSATNSKFPFDNLSVPQQTEQLKKWANAVANSPSGSNNNASGSRSSSADSQWGKWMGEVWKAMAEAPARANRGSSSSAAVSPAAASGTFPEFRWTNSMSLALLVVAALVLLVVWFSRQRVAELSSVSAAQAEWVRTVIAQGLKTRADVVRAFHQLVKQSRAVSDWWTHRSIVRHFNTQTPQLASAISELAVVYEQARYYPDDVELSPQQLAQVRELLESVKIPTTNHA